MPRPGFVPHKQGLVGLKWFDEYPQGALRESMTLPHIIGRKSLLTTKQLYISRAGPFPRFLDPVMPIIKDPHKPVPIMVANLVHQSNPASGLSARPIAFDLVSHSLMYEIYPSLNGSIGGLPTLANNQTCALQPCGVVFCNSARYLWSNCESPLPLKT